VHRAPTLRGGEGQGLSGVDLDRVQVRTWKGTKKLHIAQFSPEGDNKEGHTGSASPPGRIPALETDVPEQPLGGCIRLVPNIRWQILASTARCFPASCRTHTTQQRQTDQCGARRVYFSTQRADPQKEQEEIAQPGLGVL